MRFLLAEDDQLLGTGIQSGLSQDGHIVDWVKDGRAALHALQTESFDAVILDIGLPKITGIEVLKQARDKGISTPVLLLTARDTTQDKVIGLDAGADDYLIKPFELSELLARLRAISRRSSGRAQNTLSTGTITLYPDSHQVQLNGEELKLSPREYAILFRLLDNVGRVVTRDQLVQAIYGWQTEVDSNAVDVHVHNLRKKLGDDNPILTVRGVGYTIKSSGGS